MVEAADKAAAIDAGSNTILLLIGEREGSAMRLLQDEIEFARLGEGVDQSGVLSPAAMERGMAAFRRYAGICQEHGITRIRASGTSALRDAGNGAEYLARVEKETGIKVEIIAGEREAALGFAAATADLPAGSPAVVLDIGGGSTELIVGSAGSAPQQAKSFDIGAVRLTERHLPHDPPSQAQIDACRTDIYAVLEAAPAAATEAVVYGVSGTCTTLAAVDARMARYDTSRIHGAVLPLGKIEELLAAFRSTDSAGRALMPGLHPKRADVIIAGTLILLEVLDHYRCNRLVISDRGIRHALLREALFN